MPVQIEPSVAAQAMLLLFATERNPSDGPYVCRFAMSQQFAHEVVAARVDHVVFEAVVTARAIAPARLVAEVVLIA